MSGAADHARLREIFLSACELPVERRSEFLAKACGGDDELRGRVEALLEADREEDALDADPPEGEPRPLVTMPERLGGFRVLGPLGAGGMGRVFRAEQEQPRRPVAIKILHVGLGSDRMTARFQNEADALGRLRHPGIAQVIEFGTAEVLGGVVPYLAMELLEGEDLLAYASTQSLDVPGRLRLLQKVCAAVGHAHRNGVIHRDLKPSNVLVVDGDPKILDFGISKIEDAPGERLTATGLLMGTLEYMSPEQVSGSGGIDSRTDIYSLGVLLFELLAGQLPIPVAGRPLTETMDRIRSRPPQRLGEVRRDLQGDLELIVGKCLEKEPGRRYAGAEELAAELERYLTKQPILARPPTAFYQFKRYAQRHRAVVLGAAAVLVTLTLGLVTTSIYATLAESRRQESQRLGYRATMAAALTSVAKDPTQARRYLAQAPAECRGFEWRLVDAALTPGELLPGDATVSQLGATVAAIVDGADVRVLSLASGEEVRRLPIGCRDARGPRMGKGGEVVAVHSPKRGAVLVLRPLKPPFELAVKAEKAVPYFELNAAGTLILIRDDAPQMRIYDLQQGTQVRSVPAAAPGAACFSPDGKFLLYPGADRSIEVLDLVGGSVQRVVEGVFWTHPPATLRPKSGILAFASLRAINLHAFPSGAQRGQLSGHLSDIRALTIDLEATRIASMDRADGHLWIHALPGGHRIEAFDGAGTDRLVFSRDGAAIFGGGPQGVHVWFPGRQTSTVLRGHENYAYHVTFSPDGRWMASSDWTERVLVWDAATLECVRSFAFVGQRPIGDIAFRADSRSLMVASAWSQGFQEWDVLTGEKLGTGSMSEFLRAGRPVPRVVDKERHHSKSITALPNGVVVKGLKRGVGRFGSFAEIGNEDPQLVFRLPSEARALAVTADGRLLAAGTEAGEIVIVDAVTFERRQTLASAGAAVHCVEFHPTEKRLAVGTALSEVLLYDYVEGDIVARLEGHSGYVHGLAFSPSGDRLVSASGDQTLRVWDTVPRHERMRDRWRLEGARRKVAAWVQGLLEPPGTARSALAAIQESGRSEVEQRAAIGVLVRGLR